MDHADHIRVKATLSAAEVRWRRRWEDPGVTRVLVIAASLRTGSFNMMLSKLAIEALIRAGATVEEVKYSDVIAPNYDGDGEKQDGVPPQIKEFARRLENVEAFLIVSPEYNASLPGTLKNVIDWTSRLRPQPFWGHQGMLMSASPRYNGGNRGLWALRVPLEHLGAHIYPEMFSIPNADDGFTSEGTLSGPKDARKLDGMVEGFVSHVKKVRA
jgi:chromate reductase, NAD(P)H dehydrogenase (quinone)